VTGRPITDSAGVSDFYDERYGGDYMAGHPDLERARVAGELSLVPRDVGAVLDYGCGSGAWADVLADACPDARLRGVEVSPRAVERARAAVSGLMEVVHFDGKRAPFDDESFGLVFSYHVLEHVLDLRATVADMVRLTRPGGRVVACLPCANRGSIMERAVRLTRAGVERSTTGERRFFFEDPGHLRSVTSDELERLFAEHGMRLVSAAFTGPFADLEYLARRRHRITELLDPGRGRTRAARAELAAARAALLALEAAVRIHRTSIALPAGRRGPLRTALIACAKPVVAPVALLVLRVLPLWEWRRRHDRRGGSAQYLVFEREAAATPAAA
jgi:SAM-dependent methyltransferase